MAHKSKRQDELRLGIITGSVASKDEEGKIIIHFAVGRLLEAIKKEFPNTKICLPLLPQKRGVLTHLLDFDKNDITILPPLGTTLSAQKHYFATRKIIKEFSKQVDLLFVRLPFQIPGCLLKLNCPKVLQVAANPYAIIKESSDYRGALKWAARGYAKYMENIIRKLVAEPSTRTVTHGQEMWDLLKCQKGRVIVSSSLFQSEMKPRADFDLQTPPRLLFVGYLRPEKGVDTLLKAFTKLRRKRELKLTLAGGSDRPSGAESLIKESIKRNPFCDDISILGTIDFGEELFELYRTHDIYLLPSLSEGTPRTLVEARSFGCPVIATNVGGIPSSVKDGVDGLLVPPSDADAMADAVEKLLNDDVLRRQLVSEGMRRSSDFTLENFAANIVAELKLVAEEAGL